MSAKAVLCIEEEACRNPQIVGLAGEALDKQPWLSVFTNGEEMRRGVAEDHDAEELWVLSCDDVEPINLAASLKADRPDLKVGLVASEMCGSLLSRAHTAGIDKVVDYSTFLRWYAQAKKLGEDLTDAHVGVGHDNAANADDGQNTDGSVGLGVGGGHDNAARVDNGQGADGNARFEAGAGNARGFWGHAGFGAGSKADGSPSAENDQRCGKGFSAPEETAFEDAAGFGVGGGLRKGAETKVLEKAEETSAPDAAIDLVVDDGKEPAPLARLLQLNPSAAPLTASDNRAFVLTVVSGSGGAGKSTVSALSAVVARSRGYRTLLLDCDLQFGDVASMVGVRQPLCIDEAVAHPERFEAEAAQAGLLTVLAAPVRLESSEEVVRQLPALLERASGMFEMVVVNTGAWWAEQHALLLERSSATLFLVDQRVSSVRACRHALELCARCGIAANPFHYALNRCAKGSPLSVMDVSGALQGVPVLELKEGGRDVEDYLSGGAALELVEARNDFVKSLEKTVDHLLPSTMRVTVESQPLPEERGVLRRRARRGGPKRGRRER